MLLAAVQSSGARRWGGWVCLSCSTSSASVLGSEVIRENILSFVNACWVQPARASAPQQADTDGLGQSDSTHRTSVEVYRGWWWVRAK